MNLPFCCHIDLILGRSPSPSLMFIHFIPNRFRARLRPTLFNRNFLENCEVVHEVQLFLLCEPHGLWTQPLAGDVVTDVLVIFSCPLNWFFVSRDPNCCRFSQPVVLNWSFRPVMIGATRFFRRACRLLCNSLNLFAITNAVLNHVVGSALPSMVTVTFTTCSSPDNFWTNSLCHDLELSGYAQA